MVKKNVRHLINDMQHAEACNERWFARRRTEEENPLDKVGWNQCGGCRYFIPLIGAFIEDYGACTNAESPYDGTVRSEHDGCNQYSFAEDGWGQESQQWLIQQYKWVEGLIRKRNNKISGKNAQVK